MRTNELAIKQEALVFEKSLAQTINRTENFTDGYYRLKAIRILHRIETNNIFNNVTMPESCFSTMHIKKCSLMDVKWEGHDDIRNSIVDSINTCVALGKIDGDFEFLFADIEHKYEHEKIRITSIRLDNKI